MVSIKHASTIFNSHILCNLFIANYYSPLHFALDYIPRGVIVRKKERD